MGRLFIAEKPSVAQQIADAIGGARKAATHWETNTGDLVTWAFGHLLELASPEDYNPEWKYWRYDLLPMFPDKFKIHPKSSDHTKRLREIKQVIAAAHPTSIVNACDAGREGELIFRRIWQYLGLNGKPPMERLWLSSMTPDGIRQAMRQIKPGSHYDPLAAAAEQRDIGDWLVGMNGTRATTKCLPSIRTEDKKSIPWSIGRVQTPTLALIVDRDEKISRFKDIPFWNVTATFEVNERGAKQNYEGTWFDPNWKKDESSPEKTKDRLWTPAAAQAIATRVKGKKAMIRDEQETEKKYAPMLFDLTNLQRAANVAFSWTAAETLKVAQSLYEELKVITYPRTESTALPEDYPAECQKTINRLGKQGWANQVRLTMAVEKCSQYDKVFNNAAISDHFAIIPTGEAVSGGNDAQRQLYELIVLRFLAVFCPVSRINVTKRTTVVQNAEKDPFFSEMKVVSDPGWQALYGVRPNKTTGGPLPGKTGDPADTLDARTHEGATKPPPHYTEASLLQSMNNISRAIDDKQLAEAAAERGLGTPATRAAIIEVLKDRQYIQPKGKNLLATERGRTLILQLRQRGLTELTRPKMTAEWELLLKKIEKAQANPQQFFDGIKKETKNMVAKLPPDASQDQAKPTEFFPGQCPVCKAKLTDNGKRVACESYRYMDPKACWFSVPRSICDRRFSDDEINRIIEEGAIGPLVGFVSGKTGKAFSAKFGLDHKKTNVGFIFAN